MKKYLRKFFISFAGVCISLAHTTPYAQDLPCLIQPNHPIRIHDARTGIEHPVGIKTSEDSLRINLDQFVLHNTHPSLLKRSMEGAAVTFQIFHKDHSDEEIGKIMVQFYPHSTPYISKDSTFSRPDKIIRLREVTVNKPNQGCKYGTMALEGLFSYLRQRQREGFFDQETEVWLEVSSFDPRLSSWYNRFGFKEKTTILETKYMFSPLQKIKFPLFKQLKETNQ